MSWSRKEQLSPFDNQTLEGLYFLSGDVLFEVYKQEWLKGQKYPMIAYQSGLKRELQASQELGRAGHVHIFGVLKLPVNQPFAETYIAALQTATQVGLNVIRVGENAFEVWREDLGGRYQIIHDLENNQIANVGYIPGEPLSRRFPRMMELLDDVSRATLPPLYANEKKLGLDAFAPVKFFTPDSNWT